MTYWFDMDGTIADLYAVNDWLTMLENENPAPYVLAKPMLNLAYLARLLHKVQRDGDSIGIISWTSKYSSESYAAEVAAAKLQWLNNHLPSVVWDKIKIVPYGTNKKQVCGDGILFDDEERNRVQWGVNAYLPQQIFEILTIKR